MGMAQRDLDLLAKYENDLVTTLSLAYLIPNLRKRKLLANNEAELLSKKDITGREANNTFLSILKTKGRDALSLFITALREEPEHLGHQTLCEELSRDYGFPPPVSSSIQAEIQASSGNDAVQLQSVVICQESGARDTRPATLVIHHQNSSSALDSGIAGNSTLSQKSSTGSEISSLITTSSNNSQSMERQLISMEGRIMNEVTEMRKDFRDVFLSDIGTTTLRQTKFVQISENKSCSSSKSRRSSMKQQGSARPSTAIPFKKSSTYPSIASVMRNDDSAIHRRSRHISSPLPGLPSVNPIVDQLEALIQIGIPSTQPCLPPIVKEDQLHLLSCTTDHKVTKETVHTYAFSNEQWKNINISSSSNLHHVAFPLTYKEDLAVLRVGSTNSQLQFAKVGIYKFKDMSSWELIPFTNEVLKPFDFNNCQCVCSTRHIILASIYQISIVFHAHNYSSQWTSTSFSLPATCTSYKLQSCTIVHSLELYCSLICIGRNGLQTVEVHKVRLDKTSESIDVVFRYNANILQCFLFTTSGKVMIMKVIADARSHCSTLELSALNDASDHFLQRKKEYPFITELLSVLPMRCATFNNHLLIVYYDSRFSKCLMEIFSLE